jgi:hypothetical protein
MARVLASPSIKWGQSVATHRAPRGLTEPPNIKCSLGGPAALTLGEPMKQECGAVGGQHR